VISDRWEDNGGILLRHLIEVKLLDVSPVGLGAYEAASVSLRSLAAQVDGSLSDIEDLARSQQLTRLFTRSDNRLPPTDVDRLRRKGRTAKQALVELYRTPKHGALQPHTLSPAEARAQLTRMRMPQPRKTLAERQAELTRLAPPMYQAASSGLDA
jgi:hypothetical protein